MKTKNDDENLKEERRQKFIKDNPVIINRGRRITLVLGEAVMDELKKMMADDLSTNFTAFFTFLIAQEMKQRNKPKAGRPARSDTPEDKLTDFINNRPAFGEDDQPKTYFNGLTAGPKEHAWEETKDRMLKGIM